MSISKINQIKETLYGVDIKGGVKQWSVYANDSVVTVEWGKVGGKMQTKDTVCEPKNVGRANATTAEEQAILEATSKWDNQYKAKFYRPTIEEARAMLTDGVMLSKKFKDDKDKLPQMCYISRKLDGLRCKTVFDADGKPSFVSRGNDQYPIWWELEHELTKINTLLGIDFLDGELYKHGLPLQKIVSAVRVFDGNVTPDIQYNIFDVPMLNAPFKDRITILQDIAKVISGYNLKHIVVVDHILDDKDKYLEYNEQFVSEGYEGVMFNDPNGEYAFQNKRPSVIQKFKQFEDSEAKVIACREDKNGEGVLKCVWTNPNGDVVEFDCKMRGDHASRSYTEQVKLIDSWITFRYQQLTVDGKPQFPVGLYQRNCDENGNPID